MQGAKSFDDSWQDLLDAIQLGLTRDREWLENEKTMTVLRARFETLTVREREIMALVVTGKLNKQIAGELGTVEKTVKVHRARVMEKMKVRSLAELVRIVQKLCESERQGS